MAGRKLSAEEIEEAIRLALALDYEEPERRSLLMEGLPKGAVANFIHVGRPGDQLRHDLRYLNNREGLRDVTGRPLAIWLRNAVRMATSAYRTEAEGLERLLAVVEGTLPASDAAPSGDEPTPNPVPPPSPDEVVSKLRGLLVASLTREPVLRSRLADKLQTTADAASQAEVLLRGSALDAIRALVQIVQKEEALRPAAQSVAAVALPAAVDWARLREAAARATPGQEVHLEVPFLVGALCDIAVAAVHGRPAQLAHRDAPDAGILSPSLLLLPNRKGERPIQLLVAEAILREKLGLSFEEIPDKDDDLLKQARETICYFRDELPDDERYQLYLVFKLDPDGALAFLSGGLPELWLVRGDTKNQASLLLFLKQLFGWK